MTVKFRLKTHASLPFLFSIKVTVLVVQWESKSDQQLQELSVETVQEIGNKNLVPELQQEST